MTNRRFGAMRLLGVGLVALAPMLMMSAAQADEEADLAAVRSFRLSEDFLGRFQALQEDQLADYCTLSPDFLDNGTTQSLDELVAAYLARPGVSAMLSNRGMNARDYLIGNVAMFLAAIDARDDGLGDDVKLASLTEVAAANRLFFKSHETDIRDKARDVNSKLAAANNGRMPDCTGEPDGKAGTETEGEAE